MHIRLVVAKVYMRSREHWNERTVKKQLSLLKFHIKWTKLVWSEKIAELVKTIKKVEGISALRDSLIRWYAYCCECKRDAVGEVVLNNLYSQTQLQTTFGINMVALNNGQPQLFNIKDMLKCFVDRKSWSCDSSRYYLQLKKARDRAHILEALSLALANIDEIIELIKNAPTPAEAKVGLVSRGWDLGNVASMLERAGTLLARPDGLKTNTVSVMSILPNGNSKRKYSRTSSSPPNWPWARGRF